MRTRQIITVVAASWLIFTTAQAQENVTDSTVSNKTERKDSLQVLANELAQLKSDFNEEKQDRLYEKIWKRKKYWKFGYTKPSVKRTDGEPMTWDTQFALFVQQGKTAYLHSKSLWGKVKIGIDFGFMDISYAKLKLKEVVMSDFDDFEGGDSNDLYYDYDDSDDFNLGMHKFEYSLHVGPSISFNPWKHLIAAAYFHVMPTASGIIENSNFSYGFGCALAAGVSVSYKAISVGFEGQWCNIKYKQTSFDDEDEYDYDYDYDYEDEGSIFTTKDFKLKQSGVRFYIALRF